MNEYISDNKIAWERIAPIHSKGLAAKRERIINNECFIPISDSVISYLNNIDVVNKTCLHLCCNNGFETIGLKRIGASECVGVDFCEYNIKYANELAQHLMISDSVKFIQSNVTYSALPELLGRKFDVIYISTGSLCWIEDLDMFYKNVYQLLNPGGKVFIFDLHPMSNIINDNKQSDKDPMLIVNPYFSEKPITCCASLDYISRTSKEKQKYHMFSHTLSDIIYVALKEDLQLDFFDETEIDESGGFVRVSSQNLHFPLSFCMIFSKLILED